MRGLLRRRTLLLGVVLVGLVAGGAALAPLLAPAPPDAQDLMATLLPPGPGHPFGTDAFGRDLLSRVLFGARLSLLEVVAGVGLAAGAGVPLGLLCGTVGGRTDAAAMWVVDVVFAFPGVILAILVVSVLGAGLPTLLLALATFSAPVFARLSRNLALGLRGLGYVEAAVVSGATLPRLLWRHMLRNALGPLVVQASLSAGTVILTAASLSFLGLGAQPPLPEWGAMMGEGRALIGASPWPSLFPGLAVFVTVLGFNMLGDGLRDLLDPRG